MYFYTFIASGPNNLRLKCLLKLLFMIITKTEPFHFEGDGRITLSYSMSPGERTQAGFRY